MKSSIILLATAALVSANPHGHAHNHDAIYAKREANAHAQSQQEVAQPVEKRSSDDVVWVCVLGHRTLSEAECQEGISNGTLVSPDGPLTHASKPKPSTKAAPSSTPSSSAPAATSVTVQNKAAFAHKPETEPAANAASAPSAGSGADSDFPDGQISCSDFPDQYGAVPLSYLGLDGWTGVQCPGSWIGNLIDNIEAVVKGTGGCKEGCFCSYACPAGYQKMQWPVDNQGATGQSVGGIQCKNGKLHLTNPSVKSLCGPGTDKVKVVVQNNLSSNAAVCRTDYPGSESETIPVNTTPGSVLPLTCPDSTSYYKWKGAPTTAQYYVNNAGVAVEDACQWATAGSDMGNWAPVNLGVGWNGEMAYLSIFPNKPTNPNAKLNFKIAITGPNVSANCTYDNGQYCGNTGCNPDGCTVGVTSGTATYVFSD